MNKINYVDKSMIKVGKHIITNRLCAISGFMSPPCQFYNNGFMYINLNYIITTLKSFNTSKIPVLFIDWESLQNTEVA